MDLLWTGKCNHSDLLILHSFAIQVKALTTPVLVLYTRVEPCLWHFAHLKNWPDLSLFRSINWPFLTPGLLVQVKMLLEMINQLLQVKKSHKFVFLSSVTQWLHSCLVSCSFQKQAAAFKYLYLFGLLTSASPKVCAVGSQLPFFCPSLCRKPFVNTCKNCFMMDDRWVSQSKWQAAIMTAEERQIWHMYCSITVHLVGIHLAVCITLFSLCWQLQTNSHNHFISVSSNLHNPDQMCSHRTPNI